MDKNSIIGVVIIGVILIGYSLWSSPSDQEIEAMRHKKDSIAKVEEGIRLQQELDNIAIAAEENKVDTVNLDPVQIANLDSAKSTEKIEKYGFFADFVEKENEFFIVENEKIKLNFSSKGGKIESVELKEYQSYDSLPLILFQGDSSIFAFNFFDAKNKHVNTEDLYFTSTGITNSNGNQTISLKVEIEPGKYIEHKYTVFADSYMVDYTVSYVGLKEIVSPTQTYLTLNWEYNIPKQEKGAENENNYSTIYYKYLNDAVDYVSERSDETEELGSKIRWIGHKDQFFSSVFIAKEYFVNATVETKSLYKENEKFIKNLKTEIAVPFNGGNNEQMDFSFYFGPNHFNTLKDYSKVNYDEKDVNLSLEELVPLGWGIFGYVNRFIVIPIFNFLHNYISNYGIIILLLTVIIKLFLFPLTYKSYSSSAKMRVLKPQIDEINERIPKDKGMERQKATMDLYKRAGVNPMGGCLPMVLQMPILFALFRFFPSSIELRQQSFLWADDLSSYDSILDLPFTIPMYGDHVSLFTILMTVSTLIYTKMQNSMNPTNNAMPGMKTMMYFMPIMFLFFLNNYSSGLSYYYFVANVITFGQMFLIKQSIDDKKVLAKLEMSKKKPVTKSKFQQRLENASKQRQQGKKK